MPAANTGGGYADSLDGVSTGSSESTFEAESAARYAEGKRARSLTLDALRAEIASAANKLRPRARPRVALWGRPSPCSPSG